MVSDRARSQLVDALSRIDYTADVASIREAVIAIMQQACGASSTLSARLAADFYDGLRERFGIDDGFTAEVDGQREPEATEGAVRAFAQDLVDDKPVEQFIGKCAARIDYETRRAANECVAYNARHDPRKPKWARIPTGAETCEFCIMLASRGFAYHSEETASHAHANCDCRVVPSWDKGNPALEGYDVEYYKDCYAHPEKHPEIRDAINARRRELYAEERDYRQQSGLLTTAHARERMSERGISSESVSDAISSPLSVGEVKVDELGRESVSYIGKDATVVVNPSNGKIITVHRTHSRIRRRYEHGDSSETESGAN